MKRYLFITCLAGIMAQPVLAQQKHERANPTHDFPDYHDSLLLETTADTTANVSFGDFDGDGHLDILLVKGRHWPIIDRILLGDGKGGIRRAYDLSSIADRSYTGGVADFNGDGYPDIAVSNDNPDHKLVYFNDGKGNFTVGSEFGRPKWPTRNLAIADVNGDGRPDLILANRGEPGRTSNYVCLNNGKGQFDKEHWIAVAPYPATTIYPADVNRDGFIDLVVPYRDSGQSYVYLGSASRSFSDSNRIPFGPPDATIRVAAAADLDGDGLTDIVTIDEFHGVNIYFGKKDRTFDAGISLADAKVQPYALSIADLNGDGRMDIIVGHIGAPSTIFFNEGAGRKFKPMNFGNSFGDVYGFAIGDFNEDGIPDIAVARSEGTNVLYFGRVGSKERK